MRHRPASVCDRLCGAPKPSRALVAPGEFWPSCLVLSTSHPNVPLFSELPAYCDSDQAALSDLGKLKGRGGLRGSY